MAGTLGGCNLIARDLSRATDRDFDLVVVGGGIYGVSLLREAARRNLSACLCEACDFGSGTSWNSLRIVHGGLRYLQSMDLPRFFQSVAARRRIARWFPRLVRPLPCLMPLYAEGFKRRSVMRFALLVNDALSAGRNTGLAESVRLGRSDILDAAATRREFPRVRAAGLEGAARWSDYFMISSERILIELLRDACLHGGVALNYAKVEDIVAEGRNVRGILVKDGLSGATLTIRTRAVVNCAGPRVRRLAEGRGGDASALFRPSLAFNLLLDATLPGQSALAVAAPQPDAQVLFLMPQKHAVLAGTMHLPRASGTTEAKPTDQELEHCLAQLRAAVPGLDLRLSNVRRVYAGLLPARVEGRTELVKKEVLRDHGKAGGLRGMYSVSGVKFTTANDVALQVLRLMGLATPPGTARHEDDVELPVSPATELLIDADRLWAPDTAAVRDALVQTARDEAVQSLDDLVLRRTNWAATEPDLERVRKHVVEIAGNHMKLPVSHAASA